MMNKVAKSLFYYLKNDHTYEPCDLETWSEQFKFMDKSRQVASESINGKHISTVWLGLNHNHFLGKPLLFETMVFEGEEGDLTIYCDRYSTWDEAVEGHNKAIEWVKNGGIDE